MANFFADDLILHERIAAGGMGEIFRATQTGAGSFSKTVAVKRIVAGHSTDEMFVKMFVREATISSRLHHPNILQVYRSGQTADGLYLVMELVDGQSIEKLLRKIRDRKLLIPPSLCCLIMAEIAKGLEFAHSLTDPSTGESTPVIHRDISPSNIMISYNGEVKLLDFGFAKTSNMSSLTAAGELKGKAAYFAPEILGGQEANALSDLFSLGSIFFELLSGVPLFDAEKPLVAMAKVEKCVVPPLSDYRDESLPDLERLVRMLLVKQADKRIPSAHALHRRLALLLTSDYAGTLTSDLGDFMKTIFADEVRQMKEQRSITASQFTQSLAKERKRKRSAKGRRVALYGLVVANILLLGYALKIGTFHKEAEPQVILPQEVTAETIGKIPGLIGWFSAEEVVGANDAAIQTWVDLSSMHHDFLQKDPLRQPRIRRSAGAQRCTMLFDGKSNAMDCETLAAALQHVTGATFFYVARAYGGTGAQFVWSIHGSDRRSEVLLAGFSPDGRTARLQAETMVSHFMDSDPILPQDLGCYRATVGEKSIELTQNGVTILSSVLSTPIAFDKAGIFSLGQQWDAKGRPANLLRGDISEVIVFDRVLGAEEVRTVESYLRGRYGCGLQGR